MYELHGSLLDIKCSKKACDYHNKGNTTEPLCPALAGDDQELASFSARPEPPEGDITLELSSLALANKGNATIPVQNEPKKQAPQYESRPNPIQDIIDSLAPTITPEMQKEVIPTSDLPHCPKCNSLLRPGVVWFGEALSQAMFNEINAWIDREKKLDLMLVIGTRAEVFPAARFVATAREKGARIAVIDLDDGGIGQRMGHCGGVPLREGTDWRFVGDAAEVLKKLFGGVLEN